jgi:hypothetical protein
MIDGIMKQHVHVYTCDALLVNDDTGPKCTLLSSVQSEQMGYTWESLRTLCTLTAPDGTKIPLTRNKLNEFWYFNAIKKHHDAELTRKEIARCMRLLSYAECCVFCISAALLPSCTQLHCPNKVMLTCSVVFALRA